MQTYMISDEYGLGKTYYGIGAISGGGATSKLLVNYPKIQRDEILDYLFVPNFGASLQIIKVMIGGDAESGMGTESSFMHVPWEINYNRGYEWWILKEAVKRNPLIKVYALPWSFPGWVANETQNPYLFPNITANYVTRWILGALHEHGITVHYIGIWNEREYDIEYIIQLRYMLDFYNLHNVKIAAPDGTGATNLAKHMLKNVTLKDAIFAIGDHYPGYPTSSSKLQTNIPIWASEDFSEHNNLTGAACWARIINWNYLYGNMTSTIAWNLISASYDNLGFARRGLMTSIEPWSGNYLVEPPIWITAHTTQFTEVGWKYLGYRYGVEELFNGGTLVTLTDPERCELSIIIETMSPKNSRCHHTEKNQPARLVIGQNATFHIKGSFKNIKTLHGWRSIVTLENEQLFFPLNDITLIEGMFHLFLEPDSIYTLTTISSGRKGAHKSPPPAGNLTLPYFDNFEGYKKFEEAFNFVPQIGSFEIVQEDSKTHNKVNRQTVLQPPVYWAKPGGIYNATRTPITLGLSHTFSIFILLISFKESYHFAPEFSHGTIVPRKYVKLGGTKWK